MALPKLVVFDWDGTLVDSIDIILRGFEVTYERVGEVVPARGLIRETIGMSLASAFEKLSPGVSSDRFVRCYEEYWHDVDRPDSPWIDQAKELLSWLEDLGVARALATGKSRRGIDHELDRLGAYGLFESIRGSDDAKAKPHPLMLEQILCELDIDASQAVLVGDSVLDMMMGRAAGVRSYGVLSGVGTHEELSEGQPESILTSVAQLKDHLMSFGGG